MPLSESISRPVCPLPSRSWNFEKNVKKKPKILVRVFIGTFSFFGFFALFFGRAFSLGVPRDLSVRDSLRGRNEGSPLLLFLYIS